MSAGELTTEANGRVPDDLSSQPRLDKSSWLSGATDLEEAEVFVEHLGGTVKVRALSAGQLASITDRCLSMKGESMKVDSQRMAVLKFAAGVIEPKFDENEANVIAHQFGKAFSLVVGVIDELSKASEEDIAKAQRRFRPRR